MQGVLIVGERGTGKTSLALAVAAEAKVPVVEIEAQQLEPGLWVGQSASNVRELFQTARDLVTSLKPSRLLHSSFFLFFFPLLAFNFFFLYKVTIILKNRNVHN